MKKERTDCPADSLDGCQQKHVQKALASQVGERNIPPRSSWELQITPRQQNADNS